MASQIPDPDKPVDVFLVVKGEQIQLTPREVKHLRRAVSHYDWSIHHQHDPKSVLLLKLEKMGWVGRSLTRISDIDKDTRKNLIEGQTCLICGSKNVTIHHIVPASNEHTTNHRSNLLFLCRGCHMSLHNKIIAELKMARTEWENLHHFNSDKSLNVD